eukprot:jgi/Botrbrau1/8479/Bobra.0237s0095.1
MVDGPAAHSTPWEEGESMPSSPEEYELLQEIGKGATASVWLAGVKATGLKVAIKLVDLEAQGSGMDLLIREAQVRRSKQAITSPLIFIAFSSVRIPSLPSLLSSFLPSFLSLLLFRFLFQFALSDCFPPPS